MQVELVSNESRRVKYRVAFALTPCPLSRLFFRLTARQPKDSMFTQALLALLLLSPSSQPATPTRPPGPPACLQLFWVPWWESWKRTTFLLSLEIRQNQIGTTGNTTHAKFLDTMEKKKISSWNVGVNIKDLMKFHAISLQQLQLPRPQGIHLRKEQTWKQTSSPFE